MLSELGRGATATVYLGRDAFAGREVAVKVFALGGEDSGLGAPKRRNTFLNEAALVGKLQHPHIVSLLDAAVASGHGDKVMLHYGDAAWTYGLLLDRVQRMARVLTEVLRVRRGECVLLRSRNSPMMAAAWLAVVRAGAIAVPASPTATTGPAPCQETPERYACTRMPGAARHVRPPSSLSATFMVAPCGFV